MKLTQKKEEDNHSTILVFVLVFGSWHLFCDSDKLISISSAISGLCMCFLQCRLDDLLTVLQRAERL